MKDETRQAASEAVVQDEPQASEPAEVQTRSAPWPQTPSAPENVGIESTPTEFEDMEPEDGPELFSGDRVYLMGQVLNGLLAGVPGMNITDSQRKSIIENAKQIVDEVLSGE